MALAYSYLRDALTRLPSMTNWQVKDITPKAWADAQRHLSAPPPVLRRLLHRFVY